MQEFPRIPNKPRLPELLAPAGSPESFRAAVAAGADAVYLSGKRFGARKFAPNFTDKEIEEAVSYAHRRDVGVYVTINTLIHDRELAGVAEYLLWLYSIGVDAVLVQDTGIAALARDIVPALPLHASTQMTIHNTAGVLWAAEHGFSRVVLARELSLDEITGIARDTEKSGIGLEVFAHGALCYSFSGQCLLSSLIGGRSGNRGMCAQPCRKPYALVAGDRDTYGRPTGLHEVPLSGPYLLSPKDLCTFENIPGLVNSPVVSLKIEGRMRSPEYVAIVVSTYRRALDAVAGGHAFATTAARQDLLLAFNRGFTSGYLSGERHGALMGRDAADNRGVCIGVVKEYDNLARTVTVTSTGGIIPRPGDGLHVINRRDPSQERGFSLNTVPLQGDGEIFIQVPFPSEPGSMVYMTSSVDLTHRAREIVAHPSAILRHPVPLDLTAAVEPGGRLVLSGSIHTRKGKDLPVMYRSDILMVPARTRPVTLDQFREQLTKTGSSPFSVRHFTCSYSGNLFAPLAGLNEARRQFLARAEEILAAASIPSPEHIHETYRLWNEQKQAFAPETSRQKSNPPPSTPLLSVYADSIETVRGAAEGGCDTVCFEPAFAGNSRTCSSHGRPQSPDAQIHAAYQVCREAGVRFIVKLPKITPDSLLETVRSLLPGLAARGVNEYMAEQCGAAYAIARTGQKPALFGSTGLNVFNHRTVLALSSLFGHLTLSQELSGDEIRILIQAARSQGLVTGFALIVQGSSELMVSEDCLLQPWSGCTGKEHGSGPTPFTGIMDATGRIFPVRIDGECRTHIYNSAELCLIDHLPSLMMSGIGDLVIDARGRTPEYARDMVRIYRRAMEMAKNGIRDGDHRFKPLKDEIKCRSSGGITAGHLARGLKEG